MEPALTDAARERILDFVRPLSVGLDGSTSFGFVERRLLVSRRLAVRLRALEPATPVDEDRLFLVAAFAGLPDRRFAGGGRTELLLQSAGVPDADILALFRSLKRLETDPRTTEEKLVRDAGLLESVGAYGVTQLVISSRREGMTLAEMAGEIERRMGAVEFSTAAGKELAADRIAFARGFAQRLAREVAEFEEEG